LGQLVDEETVEGAEDFETVQHFETVSVEQTVKEAVRMPELAGGQVAVQELEVL